MYLVTSEQMRALDEATISRYEPGLVLMERAGQGIFGAITEYVHDPSDECASIFLGRGNNAGDGLVVARLLAEAGMRVVLHYMHEPSKFTPDAAKNHARLEKLRGKGPIEEIFLYLADWRQKSELALEQSSFVLDALLGTGINSHVREDYAEIIQLINGCGLPVFAVDIPSGVNGTSGEVMGGSVKADITVTMALPKMGAVFYPGKARCGELEVVDIGIPDELIAEAGLKNHILDLAQACHDFPRRGPDAHKFECGSLLIVAGSRRYSGAAILSSITALRTGCGIVYLAGPGSIRTAVQSSYPEIIFIELPENDDGAVRDFDAGLFDGMRFDAVAAGPGLTACEDTAKFVETLLWDMTCPVILDADGINVLAGSFGFLKEAAGKREIVLSPHTGELKRLTGDLAPSAPAERIGYLRELVSGGGLTLIHKGAPTVIAHPDGRIDVNVFGHPGLATAGTGDVLTGAVAGLLAQGAGAAAASRLGVYLHSRAAEIAAAQTGERGMTAGDCCRAVPLALKEIEERVF